ncbi:hypothetical protein SHIRM173S_02999 [Streptomyces hirsutus]
MLDERQMHADQPVAQLRVLRSAVLQRAQLEEQGTRPTAVLRVALRAVRARGVRGALGALRTRRPRRLALGVSLVLVHRRPAALPRALASSPAGRLPTRPVSPVAGGGPGPTGLRPAPRGGIVLPVVRSTGHRGVVLRMRPGLFRTASMPSMPPEIRSGRQLACAAFFVPHRPVLVPHAGPGPAPRCL